MSEHKAFASLSSGLLARKGEASPAMRRQSFGEMGSGLDDLGWNDMGEDAPAPAPAAAASPQPGFTGSARYDDGDDNDKGVLAALGPLAGLSAAKAVQDHIQSESQQANSVREQQADIMKHFAVSEDEASDDGEDYVDETAEVWDPEAEDEGSNAFNEHKGVAKDYAAAHKDMADLDPMQLAEPTEPPAGFVPFAEQEEAPEAEDTFAQPDAVEFDAPSEEAVEEEFAQAEEPVADVGSEEFVAEDETEETFVNETIEDETVSEDVWAVDTPTVAEAFDTEFVGEIVDEDEVAEQVDPVEAEDETPLELVDALEPEAAEDAPADEIEEEEEALVLDQPIEPVETEMVDPFADVDDEDTFEDVAEADEAEVADVVETAEEAEAPAEPVEEEAVTAVVPLTAPVRPRRPRAAPGSKEKAAFTLRLDKERHLKLRLASALTGQSAQKMLIEALDKMLEDMPELDTISNKEVG